jgi:cullin-associated NEDD8-dissociated protein 1
MDTSARNIAKLLKKTEHYDKDERYMATSDLCECLKRPGSLDVTTEQQICTAVLRLLHDKSHDVQAIAVKTLSVLLTTVQEDQVLEIASSLADQVLDTSKSELRDVYAIGLRTLVKTIPTHMGPAVGQRLVGRLLEGIRTSRHEEIQLACLDVLTDLLTQFGGTAPSVIRQHDPILNTCLTLLQDPGMPVVRKRAGNTLACLAVVLSDTLLWRMVESLLGYASQNATSLLRTMCTVTGAVGNRLGQEQMDRILPLLLQFVPPNKDEISKAASDELALSQANELRESCFLGFESFLLHCPNLVEPHLPAILQAALTYMSYDPNYSYGDDEDSQQMDEEDEDYEEEDDDLADDYDDEDDDDESWKVRRSAIRTLRAVIEAKQHAPLSLWKTSYSVMDENGEEQSLVVPAALVQRFKEREENCRVGVIDCFTHLLTVTIHASEAGTVQLVSKEDMDVSGAPTIVLSEYHPKIIKACEKILSSKGNERSKSSALALLAALCQAPGGMGPAMVQVFRHIQSFLSSKTDTALHVQGTSKALRLDALTLVHVLLASPHHDPALLQQCLMESLLPELCMAVQEQWYKVIAEALRSLAHVPPLFVSASEADRQKVAQQLYDAMVPLLEAHDVDQEIKECALTAAASLLTSLSTTLSQSQNERLLTLLLDRLKNETTRIPAIKTLAVIAAAQVDLSSILDEAIVTLASFLKLQSRSTKQSALEALDIILTHHGASSPQEQYAAVLEDLAPLIVDSDVHLSHLSL